MDFKFLHAADLHLDSPMKGLTRYEGAPIEELREATRGALKNLVQLAVDERVDFVLLAGDLYDGDWKDFNTGLFLTQRLLELERRQIPVFAVKGNHDADSLITRSLSLPSNVTMFGHTKPSTKVLESLRVAIHGQSFAQAKTEENLSSAYPQPFEGYFNIGLLHTSADGRVGHATYAPCTVEGLAARGYQYWALGHVHQREILHRDPYIVFPGNIQGRHIRESGEKGATLVTVENLQVSEVEHRCLDVMRWTHLQIPATDCEHPSDIVSLVEARLRESSLSAEGRLLAVRLDIEGYSPAHQDLHRDPERWLNELRIAAGERVWLEKVRFRTHSPTSTLTSPERDDAFALLMQGLDALENSAETREDLGRLLFSEFEQKLPPEIRLKDEEVKPTDPDYLKELLPQVRQMLHSRLLETETGHP